MTHFANLGHIKITSDYKNPIVIFGKSNTDQSYYEPTSSRINNSLKYGASSTGEKLSIEDAFNVPIKPNGITREELYQHSKNEIARIKNDVENKSKKSNLDTLIDNVNSVISGEENTKQNTTSIN